MKSRDLCKMKQMKDENYMTATDKLSYPGICRIENESFKYIAGQTSWWAQDIPLLNWGLQTRHCYLPVSFQHFDNLLVNFPTQDHFTIMSYFPSSNEFCGVYFLQWFWLNIPPTSSLPHLYQLDLQLGGRAMHCGNACVKLGQIRQIMAEESRSSQVQENLPGKTVIMVVKL